MKSSNRFALSLALSAGLLSLPALAQDSASAAEGAPPAKHMHHQHMKSDGMIRGEGYYKTCVQEKMAVAERFCSAHPDSCQTEKKGIAKQCGSEARGERQAG